MTYDTLEKLVNDSLEMQVNSLGDIPETLKKAMLYSLEAGGKRFAGAAAGGLWLAA